MTEPTTEAGKRLMNDRDRLAADIRAAYDADTNAADPPKGECECGMDMDSHAGGWVLLHHDLFIVDRLADHLIVRERRWADMTIAALAEAVAAERARIAEAVRGMPEASPDRLRWTGLLDRAAVLALLEPTDE